MIHNLQRIEKCTTIFSDNRINFIGARNKLHEWWIRYAFKEEEFNIRISDALEKYSIE